MKIGYACVSTDEQNLDLQMNALTAAECKAIYTDEGINGIIVAELLSVSTNTIGRIIARGRGK